MYKDVLPKVATKDATMYIKNVPGLTESGYLDPQAYKEINQPTPESSAQASSELPPVEVIRASMGWPAATDISEHKIQVENHDFAGVSVRSYVQAEKAEEILPTVVFYHGGGFFGGSLDNVDLPCRRLADLGAVRVFSVAYALAPEGPYPEGPLDAYRTLVHIHHNHAALKVDTKSISVMGDSAGGNLTYVVSLLDRAFGTNYITHAISLYPVVYQGKDTEKISEFTSVTNVQANENQELIHAYIDGFNSSTGLIDAWYIKDADAESWIVSPLNATAEQLEKLPKTLCICGEFDALRIQGEAFYAKAKAAGADITYIRYDGMVHAFMDKVGDYVQADDCLKEAIHFIVG